MNKCLCNLLVPTKGSVGKLILRITEIFPLEEAKMQGPKEMRAVRYYGKEDIRIEKIPEPECGEGMVKV